MLIFEGPWTRNISFQTFRDGNKIWIFCVHGSRSRDLQSPRQEANIQGHTIFLFKRQGQRHVCLYKCSETRHIDLLKFQGHSILIFSVLGAHSNGFSGFGEARRLGKSFRGNCDPFKELVETFKRRQKFVNSSFSAFELIREVRGSSWNQQGGEGEGPPPCG